MTNKYTSVPRTSATARAQGRGNQSLYRGSQPSAGCKQTRQTLPPLSLAIARSQSEKALLPKQVALPGRGSVTGEVTPKHSQFIACRQGTGAGLGAGGSQRAAEGSEEAAGHEDGTVLLSSSHRTLLQEPSPSMDGEEPLHGGAGRAPGHPDPAGPTDLLPWVRLWGQSWGQARAQAPQRDSPQPRDAALGASTKLMAQSRGRAATPLHVWLFGQLTWQGSGTRARGTVAEDLYKNKGGRGEK